MCSGRLLICDSLTKVVNDRVSIAPNILTSVGCGGQRLGGGYIAIVDVEVGIDRAGNRVGLEVQLTRLAAGVDGSDLTCKLGNSVSGSDPDVAAVGIRNICVEIRT